jgi:hypothetical protein
VTALPPRRFARIVAPILPVLLEYLDFLLQTYQVVEPSDFQRHVEGLRVVEHLDEFEDSWELVVFAGVLD